MLDVGTSAVYIFCVLYKTSITMYLVLLYLIFVEILCILSAVFYSEIIILCFLS